MRENPNCKLFEKKNSLAAIASAARTQKRTPEEDTRLASAAMEGNGGATDAMRGGGDTTSQKDKGKTQG